MKRSGVTRKHSTGGNTGWNCAGGRSSKVQNFREKHMNTFINEIDDQVAHRGLLLHPFYQRWTSGALSREALADYARQYYHHVAAFPTYLSALHANTADIGTRRQILAN